MEASREYSGKMSIKDKKNKECWKNVCLRWIKTESVKWQETLFPDILHQLQSYTLPRVSGNAIDYLSKVAEVNIMAAVSG